MTLLMAEWLGTESEYLWSWFQSTLEDSTLYW